MLFPQQRLAGTTAELALPAKCLRSSFPENSHLSDRHILEPA
jgi:hypothetical protein